MRAFLPNSMWLSVIGFGLSPRNDGREHFCSFVRLTLEFVNWMNGKASWRMKESRMDWKKLMKCRKEIDEMMSERKFEWKVRWKSNEKTIKNVVGMWERAGRNDCELVYHHAQTCSLHASLNVSSELSLHWHFACLSPPIVFRFETPSAHCWTDEDISRVPAGRLLHTRLSPIIHRLCPTHFTASSRIARSWWRARTS